MKWLKNNFGNISLHNIIILYILFHQKINCNIHIKKCAITKIDKA